MQDLALRQCELQGDQADKSLAITAGNFAELGHARAFL